MLAAVALSPSLSQIQYVTFTHLLIAHRRNQQHEEQRSFEASTTETKLITSSPRHKAASLLCWPPSRNNQKGKMPVGFDSKKSASVAFTLPWSAPTQSNQGKTGCVHQTGDAGVKCAGVVGGTHVWLTWPDTAACMKLRGD